MIYTSEEGRQSILAWYNQQLETCSFRSHYLETKYGQTHLIEAGNPAHAPILLLAGANFPALVWSAYLEGFADNYRVIAIDMPGQVGKSAPQPLSLESNAYARWLRSVLDQLGIETTNIVGHAFGGWVGLVFASSFPERVQNLILMNPAGLINIRLTPRLLLTSLEYTRQPHAESARKLLNVLSVQKLGEPFVQWLSLVGQHIRAAPPPPTLAPQALTHITAPTLVLAAESDVIFPPSKLLQILGQHMPHAQSATITHSGHLLPFEVPSLCSFIIRDFLRTGTIFISKEVNYANS